MQSSRPAASTSLMIVLRWLCVRSWERNGILTRLNFATRCARSGTTSDFEMVSGGSGGRVETTGGFWSALDCCDVFDCGGFDCCGFDCCAAPKPATAVPITAAIASNAASAKR